MSASAVCCDHHAGSRTYPIIHITRLIGVFGSTLTVRAPTVTAPIFFGGGQCEHSGSGRGCDRDQSCGRERCRALRRQRHLRAAHQAAGAAVTAWWPLEEGHRNWIIHRWSGSSPEQQGRIGLRDPRRESPKWNSSSNGMIALPQYLRQSPITVDRRTHEIRGSEQVRPDRRSQRSRQDAGPRHAAGTCGR